MYYVTVPAVSANWCYECHSTYDDKCTTRDFDPALHLVNATKRDVSADNSGEFCRFCIKKSYELEGGATACVHGIPVQFIGKCVCDFQRARS